MHHSIYETTTASPLLDMRIREPWFSTIYNWRTRSVDSVLRSSYRLYYYVYTYFSTKRPRTNINFTDIISAHGRFKSRQMKKCVGTWYYIEVARLLFLDQKCRKMFFQRACKSKKPESEHFNLPMVIVHYVWYP